MSGIEISSINKFNGKNYSQWKFQINCALKAKGVFQVANGTTEKPADNGSNGAERDKWDRDDAVAMFAISSAMELSQVTLVESCNSSKEMIDRLDSIFKQKSDFNKMLLLDKFHQVKMDCNESIVEYIAKVENLAHQIKDSGEEISDVTIITKILGTLPSKYRNFRQAWLSMDESKQILSNLTARLIDEETSISQNEREESAFIASGASHNKFRRRKEMPSHQSAETKPGSSRQNSDKSNVTCYSCRKKGHFARECRSKYRERKGDYKPEPSKFHNHTAFSAEKENIMHSQEQWTLDSGASAHMTYNRNYLYQFEEIVGSEVIRLGNNLELPIKGKGTVMISRLIDGEWKSGELQNVLYVPDLKKNLLSEGVITAKGMKIVKMNNEATIYDNQNKVVATAIRSTNNLYHMLFQTEILTEANAATTDNLRIWHERTGHLNLKALYELSDRGLIEKINSTSKEQFFCEGCQFGKQHRFPFKTRDYKASRPGELIYSDVCGPMSTQSVGGANYFILMKDDFSGFRSVYFMKHKSDALDCFKNFVSACENKFGYQVKALRVDNGGEYTGQSFSDFLTRKGIEFEPTAPYTPEQNGRSERDMRTIVESARSMIHTKNLPLYLWGEAVNTAIYVLNRTPTSQAPNSTPYELWTGKSTSLNHLKIFGSEAYVHVPDAIRKKLAPKSKKMVFVGYDGQSKNYRLFDPVTKSIKISRNVIFNENSVSDSIPSSSTVPISIVLDDSCNSDVYQDMNEPQSPDKESDHHLRPRNKLKRPARYEVNIADIETPQTYEEAMNCPQSKEWKEAIREEINSLERNDTWRVVPAPEGNNIIGSKWVFKIKYLPSGKIEQFNPL